MSIKYVYRNIIVFFCFSPHVIFMWYSVVIIFDSITHDSLIKLAEHE